MRNQHLFPKQKISVSEKIKKMVLKIKKSKDLESIGKTISNLGKNPVYKKAIVGAEFPRNIEEITTNFPKELNLKKDLYWYACILLLYSDKINFFLRLESEYCQVLLSGDNKRAKEILDKIEMEFGWSIWLLENRVSLLNKAEGLNKQKDYTQMIQNNKKVSQQIRFFIYMFSLRAEQNVSCRRYEEILKEKINNLSEDYQNYLHFKLNLLGSQTINSYSSILANDSSFPIIDRYFTFIRVCQLICSEKGQKGKTYVKEAVGVINNRILDERVVNLTQVLKDSIISFNEDYQVLLSIFDQYLAGNYLSTKDSCEVWFNDSNHIFFEIYTVYAKCLVHLDEKPNQSIDNESLRYYIISRLVEIIKKSEQSALAFLDLLKITQIYSSHNWATQLYVIIIKEYYYDHSSKEAYSGLIFGELNSEFTANPRKGVAFQTEDDKRNYYSRLKETYANNSCIKLQELLVCNFKEQAFDLLSAMQLPESANKKYKALLHFKYEEIDVAIPLFKELLLASDVLIYQDAVLGLTKSYLKNNFLSECVDLVTTAMLKKEKIFAILPLKEIVSKIEKSENHELIGNISIPILYHIYSKFYGHDKDSVKAEKCEDFLAFYNFERPSKINHVNTNFEKQKLVYFLRNLCVPQVMENSILYVSSVDIEEERIAICQLLVQLDPENSDKYSNEIKEITQRLMIQSGIREIEQSKIYVDVEGIKNSVKINLSENYARYRSLPEKILDEIIIVLGDGKILLPTNEKFSLFTSIFTDLRDNFISSNVHGLDGYLSVRIRHGTLSGQLRSRLLVEKLITARDSETNVYKTNEFWKSKYTGLDQPITIELMDCLNDFSRNIDRIIDMLKNQWLQIRTENKNQDGLFDFRIKSIVLKELQRQANNVGTYDEFIDLALDKLWNITEESLIVIRAKISGNLKLEVNLVFDNFLKRIQDLAKQAGANFQELIVSVNNARTSMLDELDNIANWFTRSGESKIGNYKIIFPLQIGITTIKYAYPHNLINPIMEIQDDFILKGSTFQSFVDIIFLVLENITKHSRTVKPPLVNINLTFEEGRLFLIVRNQVNSDINIKEENLKLDQLKEALGNQTSYEKVRREGGTGFYKMKKILGFDLHCPHNLNFYIDSEYYFTVEIEILAGEIVL